MAEAVVPVKHLDDVIECPICKELYTDPRTLPCTHTFCFKCIAEWSKDKQPKEAVSCPVCRKDFTVPDGGIQELPKNFFVVKLLTLRQLSETPTETELCGVCSEDDETSGRDRTVIMFCIDCQQRMCKLCSQSHSKMTASSHHRLVNRGEPLNDVCSQYPPASCDKHRDKYLEIYCFDCKSVVCMMCCVTQHTGHKYSDVGEVADSFRKEMVKDAETINGAIKSLDHKLKTLENAKKDFVGRIFKRSKRKYVRKRTSRSH
jgi:tripartite motif-containing protein 2/3